MQGTSERFNDMTDEVLSLCWSAGEMQLCIAASLAIVFFSGKS